MSIATAIQNAQQKVANAYTAVNAKGGTLPATQDLSNLPTAIGSISTGDEITATNTTGSAVSADDRVWVNGEDVYTQNFTQYGGTVDITNQTFTTDTNNAYISNTLSTALSDNMTFEICLKLKKVTLQTTTGNYEYYAGFGNTTSLNGSGFYLSRAPSSNKNTSPKWSNMGILAVPTNQFFEDTWYWLKAVVINGACTTYYSLDGETFTQVATGTPTYTTLRGTGCFIGYKQYSGGDNNDVVYDLSECYVKVDGTTVWTPYTKTGTNYSIINDTDITSTSFTGIAQEAIANNATGSVKTLLDGNGTYAPTTATKSITTNGTYTASAENAYGLSEVTVNVPTPDTWYNWKSDVTLETIPVNFPSSSKWHGIQYGNEKYLLISEQTFTTGSSSTDLINWTPVTLPSTTAEWVYSYFLNNNFVLHTNSIRSNLVYSSDLVAWNSSSLPSYNGSCYVTTMVYGDNKYLINQWDGNGFEGNKYYYSTDLQSWTQQTLPQNGIWDGVKYLNNQFVMYGYYKLNGNRIYILLTSDTGLTESWTKYDLNFNTETLFTLAYGKGIYTCISLDTCYYSYDLITWQSKSLPITLDWPKVILFDGNMFISGDKTHVIYSIDGINWSFSNISSGTFERVVAGDGGFVSSGNSIGNKITFDQSQCYTLTESPTTSTQVYEIPKKTSALTITAVGTGTITLSDSKVYSRNSAGDVQSPVLGTKTITSNDTYTAASDYLDGFSSVTVDVPSAPTKKYNLLDRVKDDSNNEIGTVSGFFTDANNVEYAVVCLDAQYRLENTTYCNNTSTVITNLPLYDDTTWGPWEAKETATFNTQTILDFCAANSYTSTACSHCRSKSFTIDGTTYYGQLPNMVELNDIVRNHTAINTADTTVGSYSSVSFASSHYVWSSSQNSSASGWCATSNGPLGLNSKSNPRITAPVLEIPNT